MRLHLVATANLSKAETLPSTTSDYQVLLFSYHVEGMTDVSPLLGAILSFNKKLGSFEHDCDDLSSSQKVCIT